MKNFKIVFLALVALALLTLGGCDAIDLGALTAPTVTTEPTTVTDENGSVITQEPTTTVEGETTTDFVGSLFAQYLPNMSVNKQGRLCIGKFVTKYSMYNIIDLAMVTFPKVEVRNDGYIYVDDTKTSYNIPSLAGFNVTTTFNIAESEDKEGYNITATFTFENGYFTEQTSYIAKTVSKFTLPQTSFDLGYTGKVIGDIVFADKTIKEVEIDTTNIDFDLSGTYKLSYTYNGITYSFQIAVGTTLENLAKGDVSNIEITTNDFNVTGEEPLVEYLVTHRDGTTEYLELYKNSKYYLYNNVDYSKAGYYYAELCVNGYTKSFVITVNSSSTNYSDHSAAVKFVNENNYSVLVYESVSELTNKYAFEFISEIITFADGSSITKPVYFGEVYKFQEDTLYSYKEYNWRADVNIGGTVSSFDFNGKCSEYLTVYGIESIDGIYYDGEAVNTLYNGTDYILFNNQSSVDLSKMTMDIRVRYDLDGNIIYQAKTINAKDDLITNKGSLVTLNAGGNDFSFKLKGSLEAEQTAYLHSFCFFNYDSVKVRHELTNYWFNKIPVNSPMNMTQYDVSYYYATNGESIDFAWDNYKSFTLTSDMVTDGDLTKLHEYQWIKFTYDGNNYEAYVYFYDLSNLLVQSLYIENYNATTGEVFVRIYFENDSSFLSSLTNFTYTGNADLTTAGYKELKITYDGVEYNCGFTVSETVTNKKAVSWGYSVPYTPIIITGAAKYYTEGIFIDIYYNDGTSRYFELSDLNPTYNIQNAVRGEMCYVDASFNVDDVYCYWSGYAWILHQDDVDTVNMHEVAFTVNTTNNDSVFLFKEGTTIDLSGCYIYYHTTYNLNNEDGTSFESVYQIGLNSADVSNVKGGMNTVYQYNPYAESDITIQVAVYNEVTERVTGVWLDNSVYYVNKVAEPLTLYRQIAIEYKYNGTVVYTRYRNDYTALTSKMITEGSVDFTKPGTYSINWTYTNGDYSTTNLSQITVYNSEYVQSATMDYVDNIKVEKDTPDLAQYLIDNYLYNTHAYIYYGPTWRSETVNITADMLDLSGVDFTTSGTKTVIVKVTEGYTTTFNITVYSLEDVSYLYIQAGVKFTIDEKDGYTAETFFEKYFKDTQLKVRYTGLSEYYYVDVTADMIDFSTVTFDHYGSYKVYLTYKNKQKYFTVNITGKGSLTSAGLESLGNTEAVVSDTLTAKDFYENNLSLAKIALTYEDGTVEYADATYDMFDFSKVDFTKAGTYEVSVKYGDLTMTFNIVVQERAVVDTVLNFSSEFSLKLNDKEALNNIVASIKDAGYILYYNDGTKEEYKLTDEMIDFSKVDVTVAGKYEVSVTVNGTQYIGTLTVEEEKTVISAVCSVKDSYTFTKGDILGVATFYKDNIEGATITITYSDNTSDTIAVTESMVSGLDKVDINTPGKYELIISYNEYSWTSVIEVVE